VGKLITDLSSVTTVGLDLAKQVTMPERALQRFRSAKTLQKFSSVHTQVHNHFN
jgi:hypothetical protein